jgi:hypothetical protein
MGVVQTISIVSLSLLNLGCMKKIYILKLFLTISILSNAQNFPTVNNYQTVYTRNGTAVEGIQYYPLSGPDYSGALNALQQNYPNATIVENPTSQYNCHGFAWHIKDAYFPKVWINVTNASWGANLSKYWTDGSFIQVCNESEADKAYYYAGDHSALTTSSVAGKYESKWGANARVLHTYNYCPYDVNLYRRQFFASTKISGDFSSTICVGSTRNFSVRSITGASYSWQCSSNATIVGSTTGSTVTVQGGSNGAAWVQVSISTPCSGSTPAISTANFYVGTGVSPYVNLSAGGQGICFDQFTDYWFSASSPEPGMWYKWGYTLNNGSPVTIMNWGSATSPLINFPQAGSYQIFATPVNNCGEGDPGYYDLYVNHSWDPCYDGLQSFNLSVSPNPTRGEISISLADEKAALKPVNKDEPVEILLLDFYTKAVTKKWVFKGNQTRFTINASNVKKGQYVIQVKKGKFNQHRLVIIH